MVENIEKRTDETGMDFVVTIGITHGPIFSHTPAVESEMDDGDRRLLDVIDDPQLLQSFLDSTSTNSGVNKHETTIISNESSSSTIKTVTANKSTSSSMTLGLLTEGRGDGGRTVTSD